MKLVAKKLNKIGIPLFAFILGLTPMFVITAFAEGGATGATGYYTVYGKDYANYAFVYAGYYNNVAYANAGTRVQCDPITNKVPSGYMGAKARLYISSDKLVASTSFVYNSKETNALNSDFASLNPAKASDAYYSYGITAAYNGDGYTQYYTFKSPAQNP